MRHEAPDRGPGRCQGTTVPVTRAVTSGYGKPPTPAGTAFVDDAEIDFGDIPEPDADFQREAGLATPDRTERIALCVKRSVPDRFRGRRSAMLSRYCRISADSAYRIQIVYNY